jgi:hypothetical protein
MNEDEEREDVQVAINPDIKGYWGCEINPRTKPSWTYLSLAVQQEPMDILARSRRGDYMVRHESVIVYDAVVF